MPPRSTAARDRLASGVNPLYRRVVETYVEAPAIKLREVPTRRACSTPDAARRVVGGKIAAWSCSRPTLRRLEDFRQPPSWPRRRRAAGGRQRSRESGGWRRGRQGADIVVGEGQGLGGAAVVRSAPTWGVFAARTSSSGGCGSLVGATVDLDGARGFALTLHSASSTSGAPRRPRTSAPTSHCAR